MASLDRVFGISAQPVESYIERESVDGNFTTAIKSSDRHIVIYGASKQGKTSLRQKHLPESQCTVIRCGPRMTTEAIYQSILREANVRLKVIERTEEGLKGQLKTKWSFRASIPWIGGADTQVETGSEGTRSKLLETEFVAHDLGDAQSVIELLTAMQFRKFVVLENFHYLPIETQRQLAFDLKRLTNN